MNWYVIYTKSRYEKVVSEKLALAGIEIYCPLLKRKKLWSDRWKWVEEPLFRSYCFVHIDEKEKERVFSVPGVVRYVYHCGRPAIVRDKEMKLLKNWLMQFDHESIGTDNLNVDDKIRIRSGALIDKEAKVVENNGSYAVLFLEGLGLKVRVDLRKNLVEKIPA